jgi:hypothetical protein
MADDFRTIQFQGKEVRSNQYIQVPNGQAALDSVQQYEVKGLQTAQQALERRNALVNNQAQVLDQVTRNNEQLALTQTNARNETELRNSEMYGRQKLGNEKLESDWALEIQRLNMTNEFEARRQELAFQEQESRSLSRLGEALVSFSGTLATSYAADLKKKRDKDAATGAIRFGLGISAEEEAKAKAKVDLSQQIRLVNQGQGEAFAQALDKQGKPNDATRVRSSNPNVLYGQSEARIITAASNLGDLLRNTHAEALSSGKLRLGDPEYDVAARLILQQAAKTFLIEHQLLNENPMLLKKYFFDSYVAESASVMKQANAENRQYVLKSRQLLAEGQGQLAFDKMGTDPNEVTKVVNQTINLNGANVEEGLTTLFKNTSLLVSSRSNRAPLDNLMKDPRMQFLQGEYAKVIDTYQERGAALVDKQNREQSESIFGAFQAAMTSANADQVPALKQQYSGLLQTLPAQYSGPLLERISKYKIADAGVVRNTIDAITEYTPIAQIPAAIAQLKAKGGLPNSVIKELDDLQAKYAKALSPGIQQLLEQAKRSIVSAQPAAQGAGKGMNVGYKEGLDAVIKNRQDELERRTKIAAMRPGFSEDGYRRWLQESNQDLLKDPIKADQYGRFPELTKGLRQNPTSSTIPLILNKGQKYAYFTDPSARKRVLKGEFGWINGEKSILLTPLEVFEADLDHSEGKPWSPLIKQLAARARQTPEAFVTIQARNLGGKGSLTPPKDIRTTPRYIQGTNNGARVEYSFAHSTALSAGFSDRGAKWFAQSMLDESSGNPNKVHDDGTGFGLFGHRLSRKDALVKYAAAQGLPVNDPVVQMNFTVNEIKTRYRTIWDVLRSANPTTNQLVTASKKYFRYHKSLHGQRQTSLINRLGSN